MKINEIAKAYQNKSQEWFHFRMEQDIFYEALQCFADRRFVSSACIGFVLFERIFTTRLIREKGVPEGFVHSLNNAQEAMDYILDYERAVVDGSNPDKKYGWPFYRITNELKQLSILSDEEKDEFDGLYKKYRIPVMHGLSYRLFENVIGRRPSLFVEPDTNYEEMYEKVSELIINKIYSLVAGGKFLKGHSKEME